MTKLTTFLHRFFSLDSYIRWAMVTGTALGIGMSVGFTVFENPNTSYASESVYVGENSGIEPVRVEIPSIELSESVGEKISVAGYSSGLGRSQKLEARNQKSIRQLQKIELGDRIIVLGSNNGVYSYRVSEIKTIAPERVDGELLVTDAPLVLTAKLGFLETRVFVVKGK